MAEDIKNNEEAKKEESPDKPIGKPMIKWIIIACAVLVIGIAGFFGWTIFSKKGADNSHKTEAHEAEAKQSGEEARAVYPFDAFIVNLMDSSGSGKK